MAEYNPSKIIKDGNTYNFRDTTKIPLSGTNALSGNIIPSADDAYVLGSSTYNFQYVNARRIRQNNLSDSLFLIGAPDWNGGASMSLFAKNNTTLGGGFRIDAHNGTVFQRLQGSPDGTLTWGSKNVAMQEDTIPRSGGVVLTGGVFSRNVDDSYVNINAGTDWDKGAQLQLFGKNWSESGAFVLYATSDVNTRSMFSGKPNGTLTWDGQPIQYTSDKRLKQQIAEIDDDLLTAWEDVDLVQFKYNDAVKEKSDNARLHTGYVVQQIDEACKSHNVDISKYGLYCHEEYAEETREVEHDDDTKTVEVVRPANEHYSLRYTEALIVECAYLRKCIKELRNEIEELKSSK